LVLAHPKCDSSALRLGPAGLGGPDVCFQGEYRQRWSLGTDFRCSPNSPDAIPVCGPFFSLGSSGVANVMALFLAQPLELCMLALPCLAESYSLWVRDCQAFLKPVRMGRTLNRPPDRTIPLGNLGANPPISRVNALSFSSCLSSSQEWELLQRAFLSWKCLHNMK
jgi:hypothetical protein